MAECFHRISAVGREPTEISQRPRHIYCPVPWLLFLTGMCPKADDPVTVNQDDRSIFISIGTDSADPLDGTLAFTFNG